MRIAKVLAIFTIAAAILGCSTATPEVATSHKKYTIAVVPMGTSHEYWKSIHAGAVKAQREFDGADKHVEIIWKGPLREDDREQQVQVVEGFVSQKVSGMVIAPLDKDALVRPVEEAKAGGIPTVVIDSNLASDKIVSFVATDNYKGGEIAADEMGRLTGGRGKVLLMRTSEGANSSLDREAGFMKRIRTAYPMIDLIASDQFAGPTRDGAKRLAENLLNRWGSDIKGIFTSNESSTAGMLLALEDAGLAGKVDFVGFDSNATFIDALTAGKIDAFVVQDPFLMGYRGVKTMVAHLGGEKVEERIDTGVTLVTPANLGEPRINQLLHPPLEEFLN